MILSASDWKSINLKPDENEPMDQIAQADSSMLDVQRERGRKQRTQTQNRKRNTEKQKKKLHRIRVER